MDKQALRDKQKAEALDAAFRSNINSAIYSTDRLRSDAEKSGRVAPEIYSVPVSGSSELAKD